MRNTCYELPYFILSTLLRPHDITQLPLQYLGARITMALPSALFLFTLI